MIEIHTLSPFRIRTLVKRYWSGESLPKIADSLNIDRIKLFNFKNQNTSMWTAIENSIIASEIRSHIHTDARKSLSDRDTARVSLCFLLMRDIPKRGLRALPYRDFIVENLVRFDNNKTHRSEVSFESAEIHQTHDAKEAVATFETHTGITLLESPTTPITTAEKGAYHV